MTTAETRPWESKRTDESRSIEQLLGQHFDQADAYRYYSASIRVRVIDHRFEGLPREKRDRMVERHIAKLPDETQADIVTLMTFAPSEIRPNGASFREFMLNAEFEDPSPSVL